MSPERENRDRTPVTPTPAGCVDLRRASGISDSKLHSSSHRHRSSALLRKITIHMAVRAVGRWHGACSLVGGLRSTVNASRHDGSPPSVSRSCVWVSIKGDRDGDGQRLEQTEGGRDSEGGV